MNTNSIRRQIEQGDLKAAASTLLTLLQGNEEYLNEASILASRITTLARTLRRGEISQQQEGVQRNQIGFAMLELLDEAGTNNLPVQTKNVFISYRRDQGATTARAIRLALKEQGIQAFLDVDDLGAGNFGPALLTHIDEADAVVLILSPGALDRRQNQEDWLHTEIAHALQTNKPVVTLRLPDFIMPDELPNDLQKLPQKNGVSYSHEFFDASIERLVELITAKKI